MIQEILRIADTHADPAVKAEVKTIAEITPATITKRDKFGNYNTVPNTLIQDIVKSPTLFIAGVESMIENNLSYAKGEYYIWKKGTLHINPAPKGVRKIIARMGEKARLVITPTVGFYRKGDKIRIETIGSIERVYHQKSESAFMGNQPILAPYCTIKITQGGKTLAQRVILVPNDEYQKIQKISGREAKEYSTMYAEKTIMKRVASLLPAMIGGFVGDDDIDTLNEIGEEDLHQPTKDDTPQDDENIESIKDGVKAQKEWINSTLKKELESRGDKMRDALTQLQGVLKHSTLSILDDRVIVKVSDDDLAIAYKLAKTIEKKSSGGAK